MSKSAASRLPFLSDPMIAVLVIATGLALLVPAAGEARAAATMVSNAGIFLLFLVNGMRIRRSEIARGMANWRYFGPLLLFVFGAMALGGMGFASLAGQILPPMVALGISAMRHANLGQNASMIANTAAMRITRGSNTRVMLSTPVFSP